MKKFAVLVAVLLALWAWPCAGQGPWVNPYTGGMWNNPGSCLLDTMIRNRMNQQMLEKSIGRGTQADPAVSRVQRVTYRAADNLGNAEQLAASLTDNPKDRQELTGFFREALGKYRSAAARAGRADDVGHALAFCLACCYSVANGCDVPDDRLMGLARQMDVALADMPGFRQVSDAQRQTVAENFVMLGMFVAAGYEQSANKIEARAAFVELAGSCFHSLTGLEAGKVTLTPNGMRVR
ncbi:hypothetical protein JST97_21690 [bacterium]|nr:hypothetical protein [bacterium]